MMKNNKKMEEKWEISDALETLQKAEEIRKNKMLMSKVAMAAANIQKVVSNNKPTKSVKSVKAKKK